MQGLRAGGGDDVRREVEGGGTGSQWNSRYSRMSLFDTEMQLRTTGLVDAGGVSTGGRTGDLAVVAGAMQIRAAAAGRRRVPATRSSSRYLPQTASTTGLPGHPFGDRGFLLHAGGGLLLHVGEAPGGRVHQAPLMWRLLHLRPMGTRVSSGHRAIPFRWQGHMRLALRSVPGLALPPFPVPAISLPSLPDPTRDMCV